MENLKDEGLELEPLSPTARYYSSSVLSVTVIIFMEAASPIDDSKSMSMLKDLFLPINKRFSSIVVKDKKGGKHWRRVEVKLEDHVKVPVFPAGLSPEAYDKYLDDYVSMISMKELPQERPLWELHIVKYPTRNAAGTVIFKLHHSLGDGYSLIGALLSCVQRADDPSLPITFPSIRSSNSKPTNNKAFKLVTQFFNTMSNSVVDFGSGLLKSTCAKDDRTPIRSGEDRVELKPATLSTIKFSLDQIKQIKSKLGVTVNDVITGVIFFGTRLYMQETSHDSSKKLATGVVMLNTRMVDGYKSLQEMAAKPKTKSLWGNKLSILNVPIPKMTDSESSNPLEFVMKVHRTVKRKKSSVAVYLSGMFLDSMRKLRGHEETSKVLWRTGKNSSMLISSLMGPVEQVALANQPVSGLHYTITGIPMDLVIVMLSYMGDLRVSVRTTEDFIDHHKFKRSIENAFEMVLQAACGIPSNQTN